MISVPDGDAIKDYFPAIVDEQLFYRAQDARDQRRVKGAGRKGPNVSNLFSGLATCAYCRSKMRFENKGPGPKGGTYLVCDSARRGLRCEKTAWRYDAFEASFLAFVKEVDLEQVMHGENEARQRSILEKAMTALRGEQAAIGQQMDRTYELLGMAGTAAGYVAQKLQTLEARRAAIEAELREREQERARLGLIVSDEKQVKANDCRTATRAMTCAAYTLTRTIRRDSQSSLRHHRRWGWLRSTRITRSRSFPLAGPSRTCSRSTKSSRSQRHAGRTCRRALYEWTRRRLRAIA